MIGVTVEVDLSFRVYGQPKTCQVSPSGKFVDATSQYFAICDIVGGNEFFRENAASRAGYISYLVF